MSQYSYRPNAGDANPYADRSSAVQTPAGARGTSSGSGLGYSTGGGDPGYGLHHLTALPASLLASDQSSRGSLERIERALHRRMEQFSNRDSDRFRQLLKWIKSRQSAMPAAAAGAHGDGSDLLSPIDFDSAGSQQSTIRRSQFRNVLEVLGVFATQPQADGLFDKYDTQGRGFLTLHELLAIRAGSALESDYVVGSSELASGRNDGPRSDDMFVNRGKRQFLRQKLTGEGERPITPKQSQHSVTIPSIVRALREKLRINAKSGDAGSVTRARRVLARGFEAYDPARLGSINQNQMVRALHALNFPLGVDHQNVLMDSFPSETAPAAIGGGMTYSIYAIRTDDANETVQDPSVRGFDYVSFVLYCYPDPLAAGADSATSLCLNHQLGKAFFDSMSVEERRKRGLAPTYEQMEAMATLQRESAAAAAAGGGGGGGEEHKEQQHQQQQHQQQQQQDLSSSPRPSAGAPPTLSQFSRERAPPTPPPALSPESHYMSIAGRRPPTGWSASVARNPYLQTVLASGAKQPGFPFAAQSMTSGGATRPPPPATGRAATGTHNGHIAAPPNAGEVQRQQAAAAAAARQHGNSLQLPLQQLERGATPSSGSQSARVHRDAGLSFPPTSPRSPAAASNSFRPPPSSSSSGSGAASNALNPFSSGASASFIPADALRGAATQRAYLGQGADAFANILAAPAPERRPTTGVHTWTRGGGSRPLPPVTPRTHRG